ncbi:ATP-binding protein [Maridesulfovibrio frigidus]|uniref:ATP-binding protein n=1 Tax=Maridesulfovibrio frigidus TaxID=340956 RepID=UPI00068F0830|nr:ATP-binding protein [Maridesulfovibrio frigidus]
MKKNTSLHKRVVSGLVILSLFTASLIFIGSSYLGSQIIDDISQRNMNLAESINIQTWYILKEPTQALIEVSKFAETSPTREQLTSRLKALQEFGRIFQKIQVLDDSGRVLAVFPENDDLIGIDLSRQPFFKKAKESKGVQWTDSFISGQTATPMVTISLAFPGGVLSGHVDLKVLSEITQVTHPSAKGFISILDKKGVIIGHSNSSLALRGINLLNMPAVKLGLAGKGGTYNSEFDSEQGVVSVARVKDTEWLVLVFQPKEEALGPVRYLRSFALGAVLLITLSGLIAIAYFRNMLFKPIRTLTERTEAVSLGEYDVRIKPEYKEFAPLAASFNEMAEAIGIREDAIFHEAQINKAQAEIVRTLTEKTSIRALSKVVHEWVMELTMSEYAFINTIDPISYDSAAQPEINKSSIKKRACPLTYGNNPICSESAVGYGMLWDHTLNTAPNFYSNAPKEYFGNDNLPEGHIPLKNFLSVSATYQTELMGQIVVANSPRGYTDQDLSTIQVIADLLAVAVNRIREHQSLLQSEKNLRNLRNYLSNIINSMPSMLIGINPDGIITQWNLEAEKITGCSIQNAIGKHVKDVIPHLTDEMDRVHTAILTKLKQTILKQTHTSDSRDIHYEDITIYPLMEDGVEGAVIRIDDVTERVRLEQMMVQSEKMMSVGGLAAGMAHEINNPLAAILGHAHNINRRIFGDLKQNEDIAAKCNVSLEDVRKYLTERDILKMLDSIRESGRRAATIVANMLNFSRKSEKLIGSFKLSELLDKTLELTSNDYDLKKQYDFRKIEIVREYESDIPDVHCEGNEIQQVFLNLLKNGAEAMAEKDYHGDHPKFILRVKRKDNMVEVEVEDNGPGMDEKTRLRIFEPFFTTKKIGKGTGLGLSVSYFIITDQHHGTMEVESDPGLWTRFTLRLSTEKNVSRQT